MDFVKIFKKYKSIILLLVFIYLLSCTIENLSTSSNRKYTNIIKTICYGLSNKEGCIASYKINCEEKECRGKTGADKNICKTKCSNISL